MNKGPEILRKQATEQLEKVLGHPGGIGPKERLGIAQQEMPSLDPSARKQCFDEVALGYSPEQARLEAMRCLQCPSAPCVNGCPVRIDIPGFIAEIARGNFGSASDIIGKSSLLPAICGRVCPQEKQCQAFCTVGKMLHDVDKAVSIGRLERFAADFQSASEGKGIPAVKRATGKKVAVVGSGPAGLTVAADVRREGHSVTVFEAFQEPGGVMTYGIPEFRLPKRIVRAEVDKLRAMGVKIVTDFIVGRTRSLADLFEKDGFGAVFIGTGAGYPKFMGIDGENLVGVLSANEYLTRVNLMRAYDTERADTPVFRSKKVAVLGGGNVAMDSARTALRLGAEEVSVIYRRTEAEMPARVEEVRHAKEEGVIFRTLQNVKKIIGGEHGRVRAVECFRYRLGEPDKSGRPSPVEIPGSEFLMEMDTVVVAIGNRSNPLIKQTTPAIRTNDRENIVIDGNGKTSVDRVFAGGDIVLDAATIILAMGQGRVAARSINNLMTGERD